MEKEETRMKDKQEFEDKINDAMEDLQYLNKSKNLVTKNVRNADKRIDDLKNSLEMLQTQKYLLTKNRNEILGELKEYEDSLVNIDPKFKEFMNDLRESKFLPLFSNHQFNSIVRLHQTNRRYGRRRRGDSFFKS